MSAIYNGMIELQYINYLFKENSIKSVLNNYITSDYFSTYKDQFNFILDFVDKYNMLPSKETFQGKFSDRFEWLNITDPEEYLIEKLREAKLYRDIVSNYKEIGNLIKDEHTDKAIEKMASVSQQFLKLKESKCIDLISDIKYRYNDYVDRVNNPDKAYVTTGLKELDDVLGGWDLKNESAVIAARTGFGKSWWLIYFALAAAKAGKNVGFYSGEMEPNLVGYRLDTFLGNIPNGSLTHGNSNISDKYEEYVNNIGSIIKGHVYCVTPDQFGGQYVTVSKLRAFIEKYNIDFLCIDQFSLLSDERQARTEREQYVNISRDLRALQRNKKIPILIAAQLNREEFEEGLTTKNIGGSDRIGQDATTCLFIDRKGDNNIQIIIGKARNSKTGDKLNYAWNINTGVLHYVPTENDARKGEGSEDLLSIYNDRNSDNVF